MINGTFLVPNINNYSLPINNYTLYSLIALFASIPLIFSHFFAGLWEGFIIRNGIGSFESVKMPIFLILTAIVTFEMCFRDIFFSRKSLFLALWLSFFGVFGYFFFPHDNLRDFLFGIWEKQHGILLPIALIWTWYLISLLSKKERSILSTVILCSWGIIALISIVEGVFGYNIFTSTVFQTTGSWGDIRSTATLGNPNYVAWYLLMLIPLTLSHIKRWEKYILIFLLFLGILMTKSVIGVSLAIAFLVFLIGKYFLWNQAYIVLPLIALFLFSMVYYRYDQSEKWLSLTSRFILMRETIILWIEHPLNTLFGYGPNGVIEMYEWVRSAVIDAYFPPDSTIDSSHNIFVDIAVKYGLIGLGLFVWLIARQWKHLDTWARYGLVVGLMFFSLNVIVVSHWIVLVFFLSQKRSS